MLFLIIGIRIIAF